MPARAPASIDMLQIVMRPSIESASIGAPGVLDHVADRAGGADLADRAEDQVLRGHAEAGLALVGDPHRLRPAPGRRHWVASTCSTSDVPTGIASAPSAPCVEVCESPQAIVMPGWREAQLGADHVHDALARAAHAVERDRRTPRSCARAPRTCSRESWSVIASSAGALARVGGHVVVGGRERAVGPAHLAPGEPQALERLRGGHLVHEVQVHVDQRRPALALGRAHLVRLPDLLEHGLGHRQLLLSPAAITDMNRASRAPGFSKWCGRSASNVTASPSREVVRDAVADEPQRARRARPRSRGCPARGSAGRRGRRWPRRRASVCSDTSARWPGTGGVSTS